MENHINLTESLYYILLSLDQPLHGYGVIRNIEKITNNRISMATGTLYGALNNLINKEWIILVNEEKIRGKKTYLLTDKGRRVLKKEIIRLQELTDNGKNYLSNNLL